MKNNDILSPINWLAREKGISTNGLTEQWNDKTVREYAAHVAARVARNVRHRACDILAEAFNGERKIEMEISGQTVPVIQQTLVWKPGEQSPDGKIMNIQLRDVYPVEQKETD